MDASEVLPGEGPTGDRLWKLVLDEFELTPAERALLARACSAFNRADVLEVEVADYGLIDATTGRATAAAVELRLVGQEAAKLLAGVRIPTSAEDEQRARISGGQPGPRGPYSLRSVDDGSA